MIQEMDSKPEVLVVTVLNCHKAFAVKAISRGSLAKYAGDANMASRIGFLKDSSSSLLESCAA